MKDDKQPVTENDEQAADLAAIEAMAAGAPGAKPVAPEVDPAQKIADEVASLLSALVAIASPLFPSLKAIYTPDATKAAAAAVASVCVKHGWLSGGLMGDFGEEIAAAVVLVPMGLATYAGVMADLAIAKAKAGTAPGAAATIAAPEPGNGSRDVVIGGVVTAPAHV